MAQIEAYIYMLDFQVLKSCLFIINSSKNGPEVTENLEILAKWVKMEVKNMSNWPGNGFKSKIRPKKEFTDGYWVPASYLITCLIENIYEDNGKKIITGI